MGRKHMVLQSNASYFSEFIRSGFLTNCSFISASSRVDFPVFAKKKKISIKEAENELSQTINNLQENSMEFEIAREADTRSRELQLKLAESYERFWVTIGLIQVLFAATPYLENYIMLIEAPIGTSENGKIFENFEKSIIDRNLGFKSFVLEKVVMAVSGQSFENKELQDNAIKLNDTMILELKSKVNDFELRIDDLLNYLKAVMIARSQTF
jgi:hypothetical protein